jgi:hypothetical protein
LVFLIALNRKQCKNGIAAVTRSESSSNADTRFAVTSPKIATTNNDKGSAEVAHT